MLMQLQKTNCKNAITEERMITIVYVRKNANMQYDLCGMYFK